jgi:DNA-binding XRE family transcriptional regulator
MATVYRRPPGGMLRMSDDIVPLPQGPRWRAEDLPVVIRALRTAAGLSKVQFGRILGRSGQALRTWEIGRSKPTAPTCRWIEAVFGLPSAVSPSEARLRMCSSGGSSQQPRQSTHIRCRPSWKSTGQPAPFGHQRRARTPVGRCSARC